MPRITLNNDTNGNRITSNLYLLWHQRNRFTILNCPRSMRRSNRVKSRSLLRVHCGGDSSDRWKKQADVFHFWWTYAFLSESSDETTHLHVLQDQWGICPCLQFARWLSLCLPSWSNDEESLVSVLRNAANELECPVLLAYVCPRCGATGPSAHTIKYCPSLSECERVALPTVKLFKGGRSSSGNQNLFKNWM